MPECIICGGTEFYADAGFYFCKECQTQNQEIREEVLELRVDPTTRIRKIRIRNEKSSTSEQNLGWTSWEQYNFILIGMTNELVELGASPDIKMTILQLWASYLGKLEVAFTSTKKKNVPRLARTFYKRDAEIIYGKITQRKRNRRRTTSTNTSASSMVSGLQSEGSSNRDLNKQKKRMVAAEYERFVQSQDSSEGEPLSVTNQSLFSVQSSAGRSSGRTEDSVKFNKAARRESKKVKGLSMKLPRPCRLQYRQKHTTTQYKIGPEVITPMKLWSLIYLALRIHDENIHLGDMLRYAREGHLSYYRLDHLLPPEVTLTRKETNLLHQNKEITHKGVRQSVATMAKYLKVWEMKRPNLMLLIERYCIELQLPKGIAIYAERMMAMSPPRMSFEANTACFPNYEARAMAFIIVVLKILFALDGLTEYEISRVLEQTNRIIQPCVIVHGGIVADCSLSPVFAETVESCRASATHGYQKILNGGNSVDAVEAALWWLENDEYFNCGYGSVLNNGGFVEMEACLMNGTRGECGSVVGIRDAEHPIKLARYTMENYPNTIIGPNGVERLAKVAGIKTILPENMISPSSYFASETKYAPSAGYFDDGRDNESAEILKTGNRGAVGCIAWDGSTIAAGTSSGGTRGKMAGRVGAAPFMGCGLFANDNCACCLTGHGESIVKMALARTVVDQLAAYENATPRKVLKKRLNDLANTSGRQAGGIVLRTDGTFGTYCTNETHDPMPWAIARNHLITGPSADGEEKTEKYRNTEEEKFAALSRGVLESKLFSFCEWQRYVEARRNVLTNVHFPTKLKRDPDASGNSHLYLKFLATMRAKSSDREEPVIESYKHLIPRELADAMKKIIGKLDENAFTVRNDTETFAPSLTPQYSYFQQLLQHPERDLPSDLRADFYSTQVGYMTKPEALRALAARCNVNLGIADTGIHFLEKVVSTFKQSNLPSIQEFNTSVQVEKPVVVKTCSGSMTRELCDNLEEYLHRKNPGSLFIDRSKLDEYDSVLKTSTRRRNDTLIDNSYDDFGFGEVFPSGKLFIRNDDDSEDDENAREPMRKSTDETGRVGENTVHSTIDFLAKYNLSLSNYEKNSLAGTLSNDCLPRASKTKRKTSRDPVTGKFVSGCTEIREETKHAPSTIRSRREIGSTRQVNEATSRVDFDVSASPNALDSSYDFGLEDNDISILHDTSVESVNTNDTGDKHYSTLFNHSETLFRPYTDYWMLRCNFSRVKQKSFRELEKNLPSTFRWLLDECSSVIEMTEEDLYEEVCLVETYYSDVLRPTECPLTGNRYNDEKYRSKAHCNAIKKKW